VTSERESADEFEIIDRYATRWRYRRADGYSWRWINDKKTVEVRLDDDRDFEPRVVAEYPEPARVGDVTSATMLSLGLREHPALSKQDRELIKQCLCMIGGFDIRFNPAQELISRLGL
jgi:hypothetical protein